VSVDALELSPFASRRVPLLLQTEAAECALACLAMVAGAHGHRTDLATLRQRFSLSLKGATMADLVRMAGELQFNSRALRVEPEQLEQLALPCVLHWDLNHFVVLADLRGGVATLHDPARGVRRMSLAELSRHFTGVALELTPAADFSPRIERQSVRLADLIGPVQGLKRSLAQIVLLALALEAFVLGSPFLLQWVVDDVVVSADRDLLLTLGVGFVLLVLLQTGTAALRSWAVLHLSATLNLQWLGNVFAHLMRLPVAWFDKRHAGDVWSRFASVQQIQKTLSTHFVEALIDGLLVVATLAMMAFYSVTLTAIVLAAVTAYALLRWAFFRPLRQATEETLVHEAQQASHFLESLRAIQAIKLFNRQADRQARFMNRVVDAMNAGLATRKLEILFSVLHRLLFGVERVAVVWVGALMVMDQRFSVGMLFAFVAFKEQFAQRVSALIDKGVELRMLRLQGERLADIVTAAPEDMGVPRLSERPLEAGIELRGVSFRYADNEADVLRGVSLLIEPGEAVAIVGPSGCGKTTLLKMILGIHAPQGGDVRVGGLPLARSGCRSLARDGGHGDAGRHAAHGVGGRQHLLLRRRARPGLDGRVRAHGGGARRDRGDADGLPHAGGRVRRQPVGWPAAAPVAGARALQAAARAAAGRGHQLAGRRARAAGEPEHPAPGTHAGDRGAPPRDHRQRVARGGAAGRARVAGPALGARRRPRLTGRLAARDGRLRVRRS
jgi:ATP-binding cassette subfamily B protein RaxB